MLSVVGIQFIQRDAIIPATVQIRGVTTGLSKDAIFAEKDVPLSETNLGGETRINFDDPFYAEVHTNDAVVLLTNCTSYKVRTSMMGAGAADPLADTPTQSTIEFPENAMTQPEGGWDKVHGELMIFANPGFNPPPINRLEAFDPNGRCVYSRVLAAVETNDLIRPVWLYHCNPGHDTEWITSGKWTQKCRNDIFESRVNKQPQTGVL